MPIDSRAKGCEYELEIAEHYSLWWFKVKRAIRRTPLSGGWSRTIATGDLISELDPWPFSVECKNNTSWEFKNDLFHPTLGVIGEFWRQCTTAAEKESKMPVLNFHGMRTRHFMMYRTEDIQWPPAESVVPHFKVRDGEGKECVIVDFNKSFLVHTNPEELIESGLLKMLSGSENLEKYRQALVVAQEKFGPKKSENSSKP